MATKTARRKKHNRHAPTAKPYIFTLVKQRPGQPAVMIADPQKMVNPPVTTKTAEALVCRTRHGAWKHIKRHPHLRKKWWYQRAT